MPLTDTFLPLSEGEKTTGHQAEGAGLLCQMQHYVSSVMKSVASLPFLSLARPFRTLLASLPSCLLKIMPLKRVT